MRFLLGVLSFGWWVALGGGQEVPASHSPEMAVGVDSEVEARERVLTLRREIARHDELYFRRSAPEISDHEYDRLKAELRRLEASVTMPGEEPVAQDGTPGDDRTGEFATHAHAAPMLGLDKAYSAAEVAAFHARVAAKLGHEDVLYRVEAKYDGLAVSLTYERGRLVRAVTRGNGTEGDDITENARLVRGLPASLAGAEGVKMETVGAGAERAKSWPERVELRGEIYLTLAEFARINAARETEGEAAFAHPRNVAAGTIRSRDGAAVGERGLSWVCYGWGEWSPEETEPETLADFQARLADWALPRPSEARLARGGGGLANAVAEMREAGTRGGFPADGVVIKVESVAEQRALGSGTGAPRWALARKFAPARAATCLRAITWQVGRTGVLTPVAELEPVALAGSSVARATLHNPGEIARRDLRVGDWVWVEKAGEIIPSIVGVDLARRPALAVAFELPETCPGCAVPLARLNETTGTVSALRCENERCPVRVTRRIAHYASPAASGVSGLGPAMIEELVARGRLRGPWDLYRLRESDLTALPRVGEKVARRILASIEASRVTAERSAGRWIFGLGWPGVGAGGARKLAAVFPDLEALARADEGALVAAGLPAEVARELSGWLRDESGREEVAEWMALGFGKPWGASAPAIDAEPSPGLPAGVLTGEVVAVTGTLARGSRAQVMEELRAAGARTAEDFTRDTTLLVAGANPSPAKLAAARERGVRVMGEDELARLFSGAGKRE